MPLFSQLKYKILAALAGTALSVAMVGSAQAQQTQCPDWQLGGVPISVTATNGGPQSLPVMAGGSLDASQCQALNDVHPLGYVTAAPNFSINYDAQGANQDLDLRVQSDCDTTMLVNDPSAQWQFNDDADGGLSPHIRVSGAASGRYDVWVGSYDSQACPATLTVESSAHQQAVCPDWSTPGQRIDVVTGQSQSASVVAGGPVSMFDNQCNIPAQGYVAQTPDFSVYLDTQSQLTTLDLSVQADCDTVLLVNDPATNWVFDDDTNAMQPRIEIGDAQSGRYDVWVGTYGSDTCQATLNVSASSPQAPQPQAPVGK